MGRIFERFGNLRFDNEAEVSNRLVVPLFTDFLGYKENEILPEHLQPAVSIPLNRERELDGVAAKIKPDFMVALEGNKQQIVFSFDTKGPNESLDDHLQQLLAYCISVGKNLVAITNGTEFRIYNANDLLFQATSIATLDIQFSELRKLLHKEVAHISLAERIRSLDDEKARGSSVEAIENEQRRRLAVEISDFIPYLQIVANSPDELTLPPSISDAFQIPLKRFPSQELYTFFPPRTDLDLKRDVPRTYNHILEEIPLSSILIVGESGIGKTSLLTQIAREYARACQCYDSALVPVLIKLGQYTSTNNLRVLISNQLGKGDPSISELEVANLLRGGHLLLLLDAYDEVIDTYLHNLQQEIETMLHDFRCTVVITTRHFRDPQLSLVTKYELQPLTPQKIRGFSKMYLGADFEAFLSEITRKDLGHVASNTLLLTFLILLHLNNQELPRSRTQVIHAVVTQLEKWVQSKPIRRFHHELPWQIKLDMLSELAFLSFTKSDSYTLDRVEADRVLAEKLDDLEASRTVPRGMLLPDAYEQLEGTGLIHLQDSSVSFWHRAFQEYLASLQIAERVQSGQIQIGDFIKVPKWESLFPSVAFLNNNPNALIHDLLSYNVFAAGRAIIECDLERGSAYEKTAECLKLRCMSKQRAIRQLAINLLRHIGGEYVGEKFRELLESEHLKENGEFEHIRKIALVEIARRKIPNAHTIVYAHLNWHSYTSMNWMNEEVHAGAAVIEALSWFDDEESQQHIVDRWTRKIDFPTRESCRDALIRIADRGALGSSVKQALLDWFIGRRSQDSQPTNVVPLESNEKVEVDYWGVQSVLIAIHDVSLALQLIPALVVADNREFQVNCIIEILKTFNEPEIIEALIQQTLLHKNNLVLCARFLDVLSEIEGEIPIEIFLEFVQDELPSAAKAYAIRGLGKLSFDRIEGTILAAIHPPSYERLVEINNEYLIRQVLQLHGDAKIIQIITDFALSSNLADDARSYLQLLLTRGNDASELLNQLAKTNASPDAKWDIITNRQHLSSEMLQQVIPDLLSPLPNEYLLITNPCDYARVQDEIFHVLGRHGQIALLVKAENRPMFLYNTSSETLFQLIRRDKVHEMEPFVSSFIDRRDDDHDVARARMVVDAVWVLADLGKIQQAQQIIEQTLEDIDLSRDHDDWILGDILKGIYLLPPNYAVAQIEKIWSNRTASNSVLLPDHCIEALERVGTKQALDMLARIVQETLGQSEDLLVPERALRAIQQISPVEREDWFIQLLQQDPQDRHVIQRVIDMLGMIGNLQGLPIIEQYFKNHPSERIKYVAFWAIHNTYKSKNEVWYNNEETGCL